MGRAVRRRPRSVRPTSVVPLCIGLVGLLGAMLAGAQEAPAQEPEREGLPPVVSLPAELDVVLRAYEDAWSARDADRLAGLFTDAGWALRPRRLPVTGRDALRTAYAGSGGPLVLRAYAWGVDGSVAYVIGGFALDAADAEVGKFVLALERGPDGDWLIAADIDNGN
jgi:ketosteroid isomerase-like protein